MGVEHGVMRQIVGAMSGRLFSTACGSLGLGSSAATPPRLSCYLSARDRSWFVPVSVVGAEVGWALSYRLCVVVVVGGW